MKASEVSSGPGGRQLPLRSAAASEVSSGLGGRQWPRMLTAVMFQCLSGPKMHEKAFYSQEGRKEGQNGHVDLHASPQVKIQRPHISLY